MKQKRILAWFGAALFTISGVYGIQRLTGVFAETQNDPQEVFARDYTVDDIVEIPNYYFEVEGKKLLGDKTVVFPDGRIYRIDRLHPSQMGLYTVRYRHEELSKEFQFYVKGNRYSILGEGTASYATNKWTPNNKALNISLGAGATFYFNEIVNLKELKKNQPLINYYYASRNPGVPDAYTLKIRFTDAYDESRYLQYEIDASREGYKHNVVYVRCGGENQVPTGYEVNWNRLHRGTIFGTPTSANAYCCNADFSPYTEEQYVDNNVELFFDYETMSASIPPNAFGQSEICDLNDSKYFTEYWQGLTTGECKISLWFDNLLSASSTICVTQLAGSDIKGDYFADRLDPILEVKDVFEQMPDAVINQKYRFLKASSFDQYSGDLETSVRVFRDYYTEDKSEVAHEKDGFVPKRVGLYYLEYLARDHSGNTVKKVYEVMCHNLKHDFSLSLEEGYMTEAFVGKSVEVAKPKVDGNIGEVESKIIVADPDGKEFEVSGSFVPEKAGNYQIKYLVSDFVGTVKEISYQINVTISNAPVINETVCLLDYYIAGSEYTLPELYGTDYNKQSDREVKANISLDDGGTITKLEGNKVNFPVSSTLKRQVKIKYTCQGSSSENSEEYLVDVVSPNDSEGIHMERYFDVDGLTSSTSKTAVSLNGNSTGKATFVNPLAISGFAMSFAFTQGKTNFDRFNVYLRDSYNDDQAVKISYLGKDSGIPQVIINDNEEFVFTGSETIGGGAQFINFDIKNYKIQTNDAITIPVKQYQNGKAFKGFDSDAVYLTLEFENSANNEVEVSIKKINKQTINSSKKEYIAPSIVLSDVYGGSKDLNETVKICSAKVFDVLDPNPTLNLTAYDGEEKVINNLNGQPVNEIDCSSDTFIKITSYGSYRVKYSAKDNSDNSVNLTYLINVYDKESPAIKLNENNPSSVAINSTVKLSSATVSDNLTDASKIVFKVFVILPSGYMEEVKNYSYQFTQKGLHIVRYFAKDEAGNVAILDSKILVVKE